MKTARLARWSTLATQSSNGGCEFATISSGRQRLLFLPEPRWLAAKQRGAYPLVCGPRHHCDAGRCRGGCFGKSVWTAAIATAAGKISLRFGLMPFAITAQFLHGVTLILAVILFSQGVNTTLQRIPFAFGWRIRVSTLDWAGFLLVLVLSTIVCLRLTTQLGPHLTTAVKASIEELGSISPDMAASLSGLRPEHVSRDVTLITGACAVTVYLLQRLLCLVCWLKTMAASITAGMWFGCFCMAQAMVGSYMFHAVSLFPQQQSLGRQLALLSPLMAWMERFDLAPRAIGNGNLLAGFFGLQLGLWVLIGLLLFRRERQLRIKLAIWRIRG
ncbi:MAG UNVERIFIED_CONTAM: hypothetical protein LVR18_45995 [Planctomycetaceae bacterium]